ncbi:myrosinase 1-like [Amyelois transitella]|uniref:myrosinase 1-like n=1 Tax=Amyelois transitella TaxID=680683 RepID=UPI00298F9178|nr:myrosinase 1-like [Amyelois transitella]
MVPYSVIFTLILLTSYVSVSTSKASDGMRHDVRHFPDGFLFGTATASYQIEGAWNEDGKSENIWDHMTHENPCVIDDCSNGDIADDSYHQYKRDVEMMRELGLHYYRFSLSWSRILPTSFPDKINEAGVAYYNNLINEMLKYNIEPMVTLYHWDLPQKLQELGGWANPHIVDWFGDYARIAFELFGDRVKYWITMNEPREVCYQGYGYTTKAPRLNIHGIAEYMCAKNLLVAHAKAYHIYDEEYRALYGGTIGITLSITWHEPESEDDAQAAEDENQFEWGIYVHPVFSVTGDFPPVMKEKIAAKSAAQGFARSRLPEFTAEEIEYVRGSSDFLGMNYYTAYLVYRNESVYSAHAVPSFYDDMDCVRYQPANWEGGASKWLKKVSWSFYKSLMKIKEDYNNPIVYITENGYSTTGGLDDDDRILYIREYIDAMLDAIEDGANVQAYTAWSLMDNFEWMQGYTERFGLYEVDYQSPERTRTPRKSAFIFKEMVRSHALDWHYEPDTTVMTIDEGH